MEEGELEQPLGLRGLLRRRAEASAPGGGRARVLAFDDGTYSTGTEERSAGERHWSRPPRRWVDVDVAPHTLDFEVAFTDGAGRAGFVASATVECVVEDPAAVARLAIRSVRPHIEPALKETVAEAGARVKSGKGDPTQALARSRHAAEAAARKALSKGLESRLPTWLSVRVASVSVRLDAETERHRHDLVERHRTSELIDADRQIQRKETTYAIEERQRWRDELLPHLTDPVRRTFEAVISNPTPENIAAVVSQMSEIDQADRQAVFAAFQRLIDKDFITEDTPIYQAFMGAFMEAVQRRPLGSGPPQLSGSGQPEQLEPAGDEGESSGDEPEPPPEEEPGDRDWTDR